jgi:predicted RNA-binding Zn ribbon-like protein
MEPAVNDQRVAAGSEELAFRFVAGHRALDFLCTLGNRHLRPIERLREPADLDRWLGVAGLSVSQRASQLDLDDARQLRETVNRVTRATLSEHVPDGEDLRLLNEWARRPPLAPQVEAGLEPRWIGEQPVHAALVLVAREAVELLTSSERSLIRECAGAPRCSLLYLDRSRARRRRWCEMEVCGSRAKMASYRRRRNTAPGRSS